MTPQMQRRIRERWKEIAPTLVLEYRRLGLPPGQLQVWCNLHAARVGQLLSRGVRLRKIRTHGWDDPRATEAEFQQNVRAAVDNLRKRNRTIPAKGLAKFRH